MVNKLMNIKGFLDLKSEYRNLKICSRFWVLQIKIIIKISVTLRHDVVINEQSLFSIIISHNLALKLVSIFKNNH